MFQNKKSISNKIKDKKVTKLQRVLNKQICFNDTMERKQLQTKPSVRFI